MRTFDVVLSTISLTQAAPRSSFSSEPVWTEKWTNDWMERWQHELTLSGGGNWEFQYYNNNRTNSHVENNQLILKPGLLSELNGEDFLWTGNLNIWGGSDADACTQNEWYGCERQGSGSNYLNPITSARVRSSKSFSFKYGRIEFEAKMPRGDWLWPAIWLLPEHQAYGKWPASGEIDIIEARGNQAYTCDGQELGIRCAGSALHYGPYWAMDHYYSQTGEKCLETGDFSSSFHKFTMDWTPDSIEIYYDDELIQRTAPSDEGGFWEEGDFPSGMVDPWRYSDNHKMAPFDQKFYLIMNVAVGGTGGYFPDSCYNINGGKPWSNQSPTAAKDFWNGKGMWMNTWDMEGYGSAMQVKEINVYDYIQ